MRLIGMLDAPHVRRTAISMRFMGLPCEHEPVLKAPILVLDDGTVLMESGLILDYPERLALHPDHAGRPDQARGLSGAGPPLGAGGGPAGIPRDAAGLKCPASAARGTRLGRGPSPFSEPEAAPIGPDRRVADAVLAGLDMAGQVAVEAGIALDLHRPRRTS